MCANVGGFSITALPTRLRPAMAWAPYARM